MNNIMLHEDIQPHEITQTVIQSFIDFLDVNPLTVKSYKSGIKYFIRYIDEKGIKFPKRNDIISFKKYLNENGKSPATVAAYLSALRRFFAWTNSENIYPDISTGIKAPKQDKGHKRDYLSGEMISEVLETANRNTLEGKRNFAIMAVMSTCGLRCCEIVRADVADIRNIGGLTCLFVLGKGRNSKREFVKLTAPVIEAINDYLIARGPVKGNTPLFASCSRRNRGGRLTTRTISAICKNSMIQAGYDSHRLTAHSLRHSAVTLALQAGLSLSETQAFARHSNIQTTTVYAHHVDRLKSACEEAITKSIFLRL
ncbi:MAG: tyrosine-type recombinase/integrase [Synergistaceae bacterium]|nr:tyrosine-type recombinase/integrase [Synergistaceae bacterium]